MAFADTRSQTAFVGHPSRPAPLAFVRNVPTRVSRLLMALLDWQVRARERRQLLGLSDMALKDFGASRADADAEGSKSFWKA